MTMVNGHTLAAHQPALRDLAPGAEARQRHRTTRLGAVPCVGADAPAGMCPQEEPDCVDTPQLEDDAPVTIDESGIEQLRRDARFYLGAPQDELSEQVRIGRINDEHMALTEDYQIGRITVELDDRNGDVNPVVTRVTVELPDGPETFDLDES
jgi:hypothetical protein